MEINNLHIFISLMKIGQKLSSITMTVHSTPSLIINIPSQIRNDDEY